MDDAAEGVMAPVVLDQFLQDVRERVSELASYVIPAFIPDVLLLAKVFGKALLGAIFKFIFLIPLVLRNSIENRDIRHVFQCMTQIVLHGVRFWVKTLQLLGQQGVYLQRDLCLCNAGVNMLMCSLGKEPFPRSFSAFNAIREQVDLIIEFNKQLQDMQTFEEHACYANNGYPLD